MKTAYTFWGCCLVLVLFVGTGRAQVLLEENYNYTAATSLNGQGGWTSHSGAATNAPQISSSSLSYTDYPSSGIGNAVTFTTSGEDDNKPFLSYPNGITSGSLYYSLLVKLDSVATTGDYFFHLYKNSSTFTARIFAKRAANGNIRFGIGRSSTAANINYSDSIYTTAATHLLVVKYAVIVGATNDTVALWIDPPSIATEPTPTVLQSTADRATADIDTVYAVALRQGSAANAPKGTVDGIRVGLTWNDAPLPIQLSSFTGRYYQSNHSVELGWRTISEVNNYGFFVQRSIDRVTTSDVSSLIPGHGTTNLPHDYAFTDLNVPASTWYYRLKQIDLDGSVYYTEWILVGTNPTSVGEIAPKEFALKQNYPNPFNPQTHIKFSVATTGKTSLRVFDLIGQEVATLYNEVAEAGKYYDVTFRGANLTSGVYFYKLESGTNISLKKLILLK